MHVSSISQNLSSGRWSTSALRQIWSQTASRQQLRQSRGQLWERCFDIVNITNLPRRLWKLSLHQFSLFSSAGGVGGNPREQNEEKMSWCSTRTPDLLNFHPVNVLLLYIFSACEMVLIQSSFYTKGLISLIMMYLGCSSTINGEIQQFPPVSCCTCISCKMVYITVVP